MKREINKEQQFQKGVELFVQAVQTFLLLLILIGLSFIHKALGRLLALSLI